MDTLFAVGVFLALLMVVAAAGRRRGVRLHPDIKRHLRPIVGVFTPVVFLDTLAFASLAWGAASTDNLAGVVVAVLAALIGVALIATSLRTATGRQQGRTWPVILMLVWAAVATVWLVGFLAATSILG